MCRIWLIRSKYYSDFLLYFSLSSDLMFHVIYYLHCKSTCCSIHWVSVHTFSIIWTPKMHPFTVGMWCSFCETSAWTHIYDEWNIETGANLESNKKILLRNCSRFILFASFVRFAKNCNVHFDNLIIAWNIDFFLIWDRGPSYYPSDSGIFGDIPNSALQYKIWVWGGSGDHLKFGDGAGNSLPAPPRCHPWFYKGIVLILFARVLSLIVEVFTSFVLKSYVVAAVVICFGIIFLNFAYPFIHTDET